MKTLSKLILSFTALILFSGTLWATTPLDPRDPDIAYDSSNNRYLMVWEEEISSGNFQIFGQFRNADGTAAGGSPTRLSPDRPTQGCFYQNFDSDNGDVTTPTNCPLNKNPAVAYNNGRFIIVWEVRGTAAAPAASPDNQFSGIFARVVDAGTLNPSPGWEEGLLISKVQVAANNADSTCGDRHACNDGQIQAWGQAINPDVAPRLNGGGFIVTWQTNKDFIGCADAARRLSFSIYARYVDQSFSAGSTTNPPMFPVFQDDSAIADQCEPPANVDIGRNPRIAYNQTNNDFVIAYEVARASGGNSNIGAKRVTLNSSNLGQTDGSMMPDIVANVDGKSLTSPEIVSYKDKYILFASDGTEISAKSFSSTSISASAPAAISLGSGNKTNPRGSSSLGAGGQRPSGSNPDPERLAVAYEKDGNIFVALLDEALAVQKGPTNISTGIATANRAVEVASDYHDFVATWHGQSSGDKVFAAFIDSAEGPPNNPPTVPTLDAQPADGVTWAPTRLYLSWAASTDPDAGDTVSYDVYFAVGASPGATPYKSGVTDTHFIIQTSTDGRAAYNPDGGVTAIYLAPSQNYAWKICAKDNHDASTCSPTRTFHTDDSVVGWWRFDENPVGPVCAGGGAGETVCDYSGKGNHGIPSGGPTWLAPMADILGRALQFDGVDDKVEVTDSPTLSVGTGITLSCRFDPVNTGTILSKDSPAAGPYFLTVNPSNIIFFGTYVSGMYKTAEGDYSALAGNFFRATGVYSGPTIDLYINQTLTGSTPTPGIIVNNSNLIKFGFIPPSSFHNGNIDECIIINRSIGATEKTNLVSSDI